MKTLVIGNIEFNIEMIVGSPVGQLTIMHSAKCLETGTVYNKKKANEYFMVSSDALSQYKNNASFNIPN